MLNDVKTFAYCVIPTTNCRARIQSLGNGPVIKLVLFGYNFEWGTSSVCDDFRRNLKVGCMKFVCYEILDNCI